MKEMCMKDQEDPIKEETNPIEEGLSDLPVTDEQASKTSGGEIFSVNFAAIKYSYKPQKPDGTLD
jgi:hypothetical protein